MIYFGIENNIIPEIGKKYVFIHKGMLHIGECVPCESTYKWAMKDLNDEKIYYPYSSEILDIDSRLMSAGWVRCNKPFNDRILE